jgi:hypothetical protein
MKMVIHVIWLTTAASACAARLSVELAEGARPAPRSGPHVETLVGVVC